MITPIEWQNRIIGYSVKPADQFKAHERNWRRHPTTQQNIMRQALGKVGWVGVVMENVQTGNVVDGHERVWEALDNNNADVPFIQVDLTPSEEEFVLATFDAIGHMAVTDGEQLTALLKDIQAGDESLVELANSVAIEMGTLPPVDYAKEWQGMPEYQAEDQRGITLTVHFLNTDDRAAFIAKLGYSPDIMNNSFWYPERPEKYKNQTGIRQGLIYKNES